MTLADSLSREDNDLRATEILSRAKSLVTPALQATTKRLGDELGPVIDHHFLVGGKSVRAGLALLSANAAGASDDVGLAGALAIELVHNFSLIHDDIIDGDLERRHHPTVWATFGVGQAIIAGDALSTLAFQVLFEDTSPYRLAAATCLANATQAMIIGQAQDVASEQKAALTVEECLSMEAGKTGALLSCAASIGAILAGASDDVVSALADYGSHLGFAFQAVDDMLGVWGEASVTGKPVGNDLRLHKKTLPISIANSKGFEIFTAPEDHELSDDEVADAMVFLDECGARYETMELAERELRAALDALTRVTLDDDASAKLAIIARYVVERDQ
ncbi:MAG: polyprenyl synthetase family protein [Acidimicrobiales bacterium]